MLASTLVRRCDPRALILPGRSQALLRLPTWCFYRTVSAALLEPGYPPAAGATGGAWGADVQWILQHMLRSRTWDRSQRCTGSLINQEHLFYVTAWHSKIVKET